MLNKKAYFLTPILLVILIILAISINSFKSNTDSVLAKDIQSLSEIENARLEISKKSLDIINFAKIATYTCSNNYCYNKTNYTSLLIPCITSNLTSVYNDTTWNLNLTNESNKIYLSFKTTEFKDKNNIITSPRRDIKEMLNPSFFKVC